MALSRWTNVCMSCIRLVGYVYVVTTCYLPTQYRHTRTLSTDHAYVGRNHDSCRNNGQEPRMGSDPPFIPRSFISDRNFGAVFAQCWCFILRGSLEIWRRGRRLSERRHFRSSPYIRTRCTPYLLVHRPLYLYICDRARNPVRLRVAT